MGERRPEQQDGVVYYQSEYSDLDTNEYFGKLRVVDDLNIQKPTLGLRRLVLKGQCTLFPLSTAIYFLADLIKLAKATTWFIDSSGQVFQHKKLTRAKLATHKIKQVLPAQATGCVLELEGLVHRFKCIRHPQPHERWAAVLQIGLSYVLFGLLEEPIKTSWRKV